MVRLIAFCSSAVNWTSIGTKPFGALDFGLNQSKSFTVFSVISRFAVSIASSSADRARDSGRDKLAYAEAQVGLGDLYEAGLAEPQDFAQAAAWFRKAAEQGDAEAQYSLVGLYYIGQGVPQDWEEAYFWHDLAAAGKLDASNANDAAKYRDKAASHLTPADLSRAQARARKWFEAHQAKPQ
jgi:TPR repeat protein